MTDERMRKRLAQMPTSCRGVYKIAMSGRSRKAAIKSMCLECMGWNREAISTCSAPACPLYPYRPFVSKGEGK